MKESILVPEDDAEVVKVLKALGSQTRWAIMKLLAKQEFDISRLAQAVNHTEANVSSQVKTLEKAGLIECRYEPGDHGVRKVCKAKYTSLTVHITDELES